jgi:ATP-dependent exoDNAse (exonuclease V) beta subunit
MNQPIDAAIRQQALDITRSFAVSAPAGSGKTGLLTQRVLALLAQCEQPENILAITFTKKAAAEMQGRILAALHHAKNQTEAPEDPFSRVTWQLAQQVIKKDSEQQWHLLSLPHRLQITTIDSFCRRLSQQTPLNNTLGNTPEVLESAETKNTYQLAARETLFLLEKQHPLQQDLIRLVTHFNNQLPVIELLFINLLARRDQWLAPLLESKEQRTLLESTLQLVISEYLDSCKKAIGAMAGELLMLADYAANNLSKDNSSSVICHCLGLKGLPQSNHQSLDPWRGLVELLLTKQGTIRNTVDKRSGFPTADKNMSNEEKEYTKSQKQKMLSLLGELKCSPDIAQVLNGIRHLPTAHYTDQQWELLDSLTRVLTLLVAQLKVVFQQKGKTDFIEVTLAALNALGQDDEPTDMALAMDYRLQHILVDEFQDTSTPQLSLLKKLTSGWQPNDGRTLFVVGDAMQSCYGFRDANVGIFLDIRQHGLGDIAITPLDLSVNFRSQENLVNWCNVAFSDIFPKEDQINHGAVKYQQAIAFNPALTEQAVTSHIFISEEKVNQRSDEAQEIASIIKQQQQKDPNGSIAILVRKRNQVKEITTALTENHIEYHATDIDKLDNSMLIMDLMSLTRALLYPNDRIAWLALLRAPWCGLRMHDLHKVATTTLNDAPISLFSLLTKHKDNINLSETGKVILVRFCKAIDTIFRQQGRSNLSQWVESAWLELGGNALLLEKEEYEEVSQFFKLLERYQIGSQLPDWDIFADAVSQIYNNTKTDKDIEKHPVEIMTIHKSKGLEFDTVIIPGLDQAMAPDKQQLLAWIEWLDTRQHSQLVISPVHASGGERDTIHDYIKQQHQIRQQLESDRLFYVGCTRAINQLYLLGYVKTKNTSMGSDIHTIPLEALELEAPAEKTSLASIWPHIQSDAIFSIVQKTESQQILNITGHPNKLLRQSHHWQHLSLDTSHLLKKYRLNHYSENLDIDNKPKPSELKQRHNRYLGIVLHQALQQITESNYLTWDDNRIRQQRAIWQKQLEQIGTSYSVASAYAEKIALALQKMLNSDKGRWVLDNQHNDSQCEFSLWTETKGQIQEHIIDRTFIDQKTNTRWIIDYKSGEPSAEESLEDFAVREASLYRKQLLRYAKLFQEERMIAIALYFPFINHFYEL